MAASGDGTSSNEPSDSSVVEYPEHAWPALLSTLVDLIRNLLLRRGRPLQYVDADARAITIEIANYFGGRMLYLPRGSRMKLALRDIDIAKRLGHVTATELAMEHDLSVNQVYRIARQQRARRRATAASTPNHR